jgi:hypothetical protein
MVASQAFWFSTVMQLFAKLLALSTARIKSAANLINKNKVFLIK